MLGGQNGAYIATALAAYKKGERKHPTMRAIATSLSDQDMADIGEYYAAQTASSPNNSLKWYLETVIWKSHSLLPFYCLALV